MDSSGPVVMNAVPYDVHTRTKTDMVAFGFHAILDTEPESLEVMSYPTAAPLGPRTIDRPYVAIQAGYTVKNRAFPATAMQPVLEWILAQGMLPVILGKTLNKMPVIVGAKNNTMETVTQSDFDAVAEVVRHQCLDLRDQTTLVQARDVLGHAEAVVGVDGGLLHVAATTNTPIVYGLTNTTERCRTPVRHGLPGWRWRPVMVKGLACQGCQSNWTLVYGHDFRTCYYQDYACVTQLDGQDFINALRGLLDERAQHAAAEGTPPGSTGEQGA
jgi:ADP-heptose:LPS heptosyltransferase